MADFGETSIVGSSDDGNTGLLIAQDVVGIDGVLQSLSLYAKPGTETGNIRLGLYDSDAAAGAAGTLLATTNSTACVAGFNTIATTSNPTIVAGHTYWLAYTNDGGFTSEIKNTGNAQWKDFVYGAMPNPFGTTGISTGGFHWAIYGTVTTSGGVSLLDPLANRRNLILQH